MNAAPSRFIVLGCRPAAGRDDGGGAARFAAAVRDWTGVLDKAGKEGVAPLLYWSFRDRAGDLPAAAFESLRLSFLRNLARTTQIYRELEPLLAELRRSGLRAALTKGGRLALDAYPEPALRPFWDVDFIVHPEDWEGVRRIVAGLGFVEADGRTAPVNPAVPDRPAGADNPVVSEEADGPGRPLDWTYSPYFRKGAVYLEFHGHPLGLHFPCAAEDGFWSSAGRLQVRGTEAMVLPAENELCYLCVHAQQHSYERLIWLADIARLAGRPGLDWDWVCRIARDERIRGPVFYGLDLARSLWPGSVPPGPLRELRPGAVETAGLRLLWPPSAAAERREAEPWPYYMPSLFSLWERRDLGLAARTVGRIFFPPKAWLAAATGVPAGSARLYGRYVERLFRPAVTAARRLVDLR